jgi:acetyl-CoA C-acetyltransferase
MSRDLCIVGVAQSVVRPPDVAAEPLALWEQVARAAAGDAGLDAAILESLDSIQIVYCQSWQYDDAVARLAERLGANPTHRVYSGIGGTVPQTLVANAAALMEQGAVDIALVVGAEALATKKAAKRAGEKLDWSHRETERSPFPWTPPPPVELNHQVFQAWETFPLWDTARRAARHTSIADYDREMAEVMAGMTPQAAVNPYAWEPKEWSVEEVQTPSARNRYVGWPYTKAEVSVMDVDMAAALLVMTVEKANELGVPELKRVHLNSSAYAEDPAGIAERADLTKSEAMQVVGQAALNAAGLELDQLVAFDLYSCFPSSLLLACDALGLDPADPRGLSVTGGLPFAGGPGSGYLLHGIATLVDRLRESGGAGLVTGVGMHLQKHAAAVYSTVPGYVPISHDLQAAVDAAQPRKVLVDSYDGAAVVAAYTVAHDRQGPQVGLLILDLPDGSRTIARFHDPDLLVDAETRELVGQSVTVTTDGTTNTATWAAPS